MGQLYYLKMEDVGLKGWGDTTALITTVNLLYNDAKRTKNMEQHFGKKLHQVTCAENWTSLLIGHFYKTDTSVKRPPRVGPCLSILPFLTLYKTITLRRTLITGSKGVRLNISDCNFTEASFCKTVWSTGNWMFHHADRLLKRFLQLRLVEINFRWKFKQIKGSCSVMSTPLIKKLLTSANTLTIKCKLYIKLLFAIIIV